MLPSNSFNRSSFIRLLRSCSVLRSLGFAKTASHSGRTRGKKYAMAMKGTGKCSGHVCILLSGGGPSAAVCSALITDINFHRHCTDHQHHHDNSLQLTELRTLRSCCRCCRICRRRRRRRRWRLCGRRRRCWGCCRRSRCCCRCKCKLSNSYRPTFQWRHLSLSGCVHTVSDAACQLFRCTDACALDH